MCVGPQGFVDLSRPALPGAYQDGSFNGGEGLKHSPSQPIPVLHLATGLRGQLSTEDGRGCQRLGLLIPPLVFWEASEDPKAREDTQEPPSWVLLDGIRGPAGSTGGSVFGSEASRLVIMKAFLRAAEGSSDFDHLRPMTSLGWHPSSASAYKQGWLFIACTDLCGELLFQFVLLPK